VRPRYTQAAPHFERSADAEPPRRLPPPVERWKPADRARADERLCAWVAAARTLAAAAPPTPAAARAEAEAAGVPGDGPLAARLKADLLRLEAWLLQRGALAPAWRSAPWRKARRPGPACAFNVEPSGEVGQGPACC
jgi:hypothetical protein